VFLPQEWKKGTLTAVVLCKDKSQISEEKGELMHRKRMN
jgi:hypothetical protein